MKTMQRLGKSLMLPVACLPVAALFMGIGYWIDPTGWGTNNVVAAFLITAGGALINNIAILFIGCRYTMSTSNITSYVPNGFEVGATPDGRLAGKPLNEGASPCLGADHEGPTAVINSVSKLPNKKMAGGQLLNMRFAPGALEGEDNLEKFTNFIESMRYKNTFHNQFNVVDTATLKDAKEHPENHMDLMVRVAGYCALFNTLMPEAQDAIIARTEQNWA